MVDTLQQLELGDVEGHDFHGNQWTSGYSSPSEGLTPDEEIRTNPETGRIETRYGGIVSEGTQAKEMAQPFLDAMRSSLIVTEGRLFNPKTREWGDRRNALSRWTSEDIDRERSLWAGEVKGALGLNQFDYLAKPQTMDGGTAYASGVRDDQHGMIYEQAGNHIFVPNGSELPRLEPQLFQSRTILELAGDVGGHPFHGNQYTGGSGRNESVQRPSRFRSPTGEVMNRDQIGDTMEALAANHPGISAALSNRFGGEVSAVRGGGGATNDRRGAWDLRAGETAIELKGIHAESSQIKIRMKSDEIEGKRERIAAAGLQPATASIVWAPHDAGYTAHVFGIDGISSGTLRKFDDLGAFNVTHEQYAQAFSIAGYGPTVSAAAALAIELGDTEGEAEE